MASDISISEAAFSIADWILDENNLGTQETDMSPTHILWSRWLPQEGGKIFAICISGTDESLSRLNEIGLMV